jgi:predicted transposase YdaD
VAAKAYDVALKALVETEPESWPPLLGKPAAPTVVIDADIATVSGAADKVLRVAARPPYLLHLEFVAGHDSSSLPRKLNVRNALLEDRHEMDVRSGAVLLRPEADSPLLTEVYRRSFPDEEPYRTFRYQVVRVWQLPPDPLLTGGLALLPLAPISAVTEAQLPGIIQRIGRRLRRQRQAEVVWGAAYILLGLRYSPALAEQLFRGVTSMKESSTYQAILEEGVAKGAVLEARKMLRKVGDRALGPPDAPTAMAIENIDDLARLEDLVDRLPGAGSWLELLEPPRTARRGGRRRPAT